MNQSKTPLILVAPLFAMLIFLGLGLTAWRNGDSSVRKKGWTPAVSLTTSLPSATPTAGWWVGQPTKPVVPTMPGRLQPTIPPTGTFALLTFTPAPTLTAWSSPTRRSTYTPIPTRTGLPTPFPNSTQTESPTP
jgi:hypothetical protein